MRLGAEIAAGSLLAGKYRVERQLGAGGMGIVYAATHVQLDQLVALKIMLPDASSKSDGEVRFTREARATARLRGAHVARVFDVGRLATGELFIVMEYLHGDDLRRVCKEQGPLPVGVAIDYILQACEALAEAHAAGIIHRDLKPANLFLTTRVEGPPLIKVLDFGISKTEVTAPDEATLTGTSMVVGSPQYMSPEQLESSRSADARSDVWSLGATLYRLVSGRLPFEAESYPRLCAKLIGEPARPVSQVRRDLPPGFEACLMRCLEKDPGHRYQSVEELAAAVGPFGAGEATPSLTRIGKHLRRHASIPPEPRTPAAPAIDAGTATLIPTGSEVVVRERTPTLRPRSRGPLYLAGILVAGAAITAVLVWPSFGRAPNVRRVPTPAPEIAHETPTPPPPQARPPEPEPTPRIVEQAPVASPPAREVAPAEVAPEPEDPAATPSTAASEPVRKVVKPRASAPRKLAKRRQLIRQVAAPTPSSSPASSSPRDPPPPPSPPPPEKPAYDPMKERK